MDIKNHIAFYHPGTEQTAWLMIWETNSLKMHEKQEIKVNSVSEIKEGDFIVSSINNEGVKTGYEVLSVKESRPSTMKDMTYYTISAKRQRLKNKL